ncbi:MAG: hypothetical protein CVV22_04695 [Ignavibacteriae bacterium HGW-Ignavibacteriae-1]|jgi:hypothetical protein|nr:MAG: hypothetical protein CVV22_04695 [Ignavibacteriae bacterium HGW-Ignavibacteriae-1]
MANTEENPEKKSSSIIDDISGNTQRGVFHFMTNHASKINDENNTFKSFESEKKDSVKRFRERKWKNL